MPSMPSSPVSPRRRKAPSIDLSSSPGRYHNNGFGQSPPLSPLTPRQSISHGGGSMRMSGDFTAAADSGGGGLGSLADELADAWDDEGEGEEYAFQEMQGHSGRSSRRQSQMQGGQDTDDERGRGPSPPSRELVDSRHNGHDDSGSEDDGKMLHPPKIRTKASNRHNRVESQYDGSDYGNDSDFEEPGDITPGLEARMAGIESLVRRGTEENGSVNDHVVDRVIESLRDLGGQSGIENGATRLITAHASITSHLTHQTRTLQTLTHPLLFSPFPILSPDAVDDLIPLIDEGLLPNLPYPFAQSQSRPSTSHSNLSQSAGLDPLLSLQALLSQTSDLTHTLRLLSDTLHESRQLTSTASRRLKSARELVADMRREEQGREEGTLWIEQGEWDRRLREREAGRVCGDVVSGFEAVCGEWRKRLFGTSELAAA